HFLTQIPQPIHRNSEMKAILSVDLTSMQSFPLKEYEINSTVQLKRRYLLRTFLHSWAHRFGLHRFASTIAIRVILSAMARWMPGASFGRVEAVPCQCPPKITRSNSDRVKFPVPSYRDSDVFTGHSVLMRQR
ncbi:hypothetical protein C8R43DRAFT_892844, partial [Mycena crocata]